jgi:saccharopine dehydrogenase-like NADP-dependent oxidoreductase
MREVVLLGAGKIGRMIAALLSASGDYNVLVCDIDEQRVARVGVRERVTTKVIDVAQRSELDAVLKGRNSVVSALSFQFNVPIAEAAAANGLSYFDLTEDVATARRIRAISNSTGHGQIFMPQCGLAPGFVSIVANDLTRAFDQLEVVRMRVGALPQYPANALRYNLTWSTDGLINEYCNPCEAVRDGKRTELLPLEGLEHFWLDGVQYEAFNTSGGIGTLCETLAGKLRELDYKTIRYPGHRDLMAFLLSDLRLAERRGLLKSVLEQAIPVTFQDLVVVFCTASGWRKNQLVQISDARTIYSQTLFDEAWSAIQVSTAAALCATLDLKFESKLPAAGFVRQEEIDLAAFLANRFGKYYGSASRTQGDAA